MNLQFVITNQQLVADFGLPEFATEGSAAIDLRYLNAERESLIILPGETIKISAGFCMWIQNPQYAGIILPRSGTGTRGLVLGNLTGLIDSDYQGEIIVPLWNRSAKPIEVLHGERVAQLAVIRTEQYTIEVVDSFPDLTARGDNGFGSTGQT